jgi:hypothetical protein
LTDRVLAPWMIHMLHPFARQTLQQIVGVGGIVGAARLAVAEEWSRAGVAFGICVVAIVEVQRWDCASEPPVRTAWYLRLLDAFGAAGAVLALCGTGALSPNESSLHRTLEGSVVYLGACAAYWALVRFDPATQARLETGWGLRRGAQWTYAITFAIACGCALVLRISPSTDWHDEVIATIAFAVVSTIVSAFLGRHRAAGHPGGGQAAV